MYRALVVWLLLTGPAMATVIDSQIFLNEFHYDNTGGDENQFVEVVVASAVSDRSGIALTLYNGGSGSPYSGPIMLDEFTVGDTTSGFEFFTIDVSMQNGAPDGLALANGSQLLQFLSYEGTFEAVEGVAAGEVSTDVVVFEPSDTAVGSSLQLAGSGDSYLDFSWQGPAEHTRGALNLGQQLLGDVVPDPDPDPDPNPNPAGVPEPASLLIWACAMAALVGSYRGHRRTVRFQASR
jgi:hypothetical protein